MILSRYGYIEIPSHKGGNSYKNIQITDASRVTKIGNMRTNHIQDKSLPDSPVTNIFHFHFIKLTYKEVKHLTPADIKK